MASALMRQSIRRDLNELANEQSDENLLELFINGTESESQEAFRALVVRHGPMALGICRHVLNDQHDADDAFQATFLVLAQKASSIRNRRVLAGWLHEVAHRIAIKARASAVRRRNLERHGIAMSPQVNEPPGLEEAAAWNELRPVLHEEVERLPEKYRLPVILSYLEGKTNEEVAALLEWPVGTVKGRLSRARDLLRSRLMRRGLCLSAAFVVTALGEGRVFAEVVPYELIKQTVRLAGRFGPRSAPPDPGSAEPPFSPDNDHLATVESLSIAGAASQTVGAPLLKYVLLSLLVFSMSAGIGLAISDAGGIASGIKSAITALIPPGWTGGAGAACH